MTIALDHLIVPSRDRVAAARLISSLLGVPWAEQGDIGSFSPVYVDTGLTLDFDQWKEPCPKLHYCFRVTPDRFDSILSRMKAAQIAYRSQPHGPDDYSINPVFGGRLVYWSEPDGHVWELLTVSYERQKPPSSIEGGDKFELAAQRAVVSRLNTHPGRR